MHRIDNTYNDNGEFTDGPPATLVGAKWLNAVQSELTSIITKLGGTLTDADSEQISKLLLGTSTSGTAWSIAAAGAVAELDISAQDSIPKGLCFSADGSIAYMVGNANDTIYQYTLATPWQIKTATYASKSLSISAQVVDPNGIAINSDGTKVYVVGGSEQAVYQYTLSTANDISTGSYDTVSFDVSTWVADPSDIRFGDSGTKMYISDESLDIIYQFTLSTAYAISTATYASKSLDTSSQLSALGGFDFSVDGTKVYAIGDSDVYQYTLSTAWDVDTGSYDSVTFSTSIEESTPNGIFFKDDGSRFYITGQGSDLIGEYAIYEEHFGKPQTHYAMFGVQDDATGTSAANPAGPNDTDKVHYLGSNAFNSSSALMQVRKDATGVYEVKLPAGLDWDSAAITGYAGADPGKHVSLVEQSSSTEATIYVHSISGTPALTDGDFWLKVDLING